MEAATLAKLALWAGRQNDVPMCLSAVATLPKSSDSRIVGGMHGGLLWTPFRLKLACGVHFDALVDSESVPPWRSSTDCFS